MRLGECIYHHRTGSEIEPHIDERRINAIKSGIQFRSKRQSQSGIKEEDKLLQIDVENYSRSMCSAWTGEPIKIDADCEKRSAFSVVK